MLPCAKRLLTVVIVLLPFVLGGATYACEAHFLTTAGEEIIVPCGHRSSANLTVGWTETADRITPFLTDLSRGGAIPHEALAQSGTVAFPRDRKLGAGERIRLVSLVPPRDETSLRLLFTREVVSLDAKPKMPAGNAIALLLDRKGRAIAASRPINIRAGAETVVWPEADKDSGTVIAWLDRPRLIQREDQDVVNLKADIVVNAANVVVAAWYGVSGDRMRLLVDSKTLRLDRQEVDVGRGSTTFFAEPLRLLPTLMVTVGPSEEAPQMDLTLVDAIDETKIIRTLQVEPGKSYAIDYVTAAVLNVELQIGDFLLVKRVDLSSGNDAQVAIPLEPLTISGTVFHGETPARATLRFGQKEKPLTVKTDDRGMYSITLWQPQRWIIETTLADHPELPPFSELVQITASDTIDIHVPANALRVRVYDVADGAPLTVGEIMIHSRWSDGTAVATIAVNGPVTELPPQRLGTSEIRVRAAGYRDAEPISIVVDASLRDRVIEIPMTRSSETSDIVILLDGVAPASGAEIGAFSNDRMMWRGTADDAGRIAIPDSVAQSRVVIRHPSAASDVVLFGTLAWPQRISLVPAAPPLLVKVVRRDGTPVGPSAAQISLWLARGVRLSGAEAAFATWSLAATSPNGTFLARGLRSSSFRLFATRNATLTQIASGTFDTLATTIPYPWPASPSITLLDE